MAVGLVLMPHCVLAQLGRRPSQLPSGYALEGSPGVTREIVQQPVRLILQQILAISQHRLLERPIQETPGSAS